jgi:hypothetical protein
MELSYDEMFEAFRSVFKNGCVAIFKGDLIGSFTE